MVVLFFTFYFLWNFGDLGDCVSGVANVLRNILSTFGFTNGFYFLWHFSGTVSGVVSVPQNAAK
jgi:hypothetical protein